MRGGKRQNAGRPKTGETTKVVRIPKDFDIKRALILSQVYDDFLMRLKDAEKSDTSPRWEQFKNFVTTVNQFLD